MSRIAFLGLGAMGRRMAARLVAAGHDVVVFNRSGVPRSIAALRATLAASPAEAADGADAIIAMVTDDVASRAIWLGAGGAVSRLRPGAVAIESSTLTPSWVRALGQAVRGGGAEFLDAPVVGSLPQAEAGTLVHLLGGTAEVVERARPLLSAMGGSLHHIGETPAGATAKLLVNTLFGAQVALIGELLGLARRGGLSAARLVDVLGALPMTSPAVKVAAAAMVSARFEPLFPIELVAKDLCYALALAADVGATVPITQRVEELFAQAVARHLGSENITAVYKLYAAKGDGGS